MGAQPTLYAWYETEDGAVFQVTVIDGRRIEIQYLDGTVAELNPDEWEDLPVGEVSAPEDWLGSPHEDRAD